MNGRILLAICAGLYAFPSIGYTQLSSTAPSSATASQNIASALHKIGITAKDIGQMEISGTPPESLVQAFSTYANNSNDAQYNNLTPPDRDSLVAFAFKLKSKQLIPNTSLESLMVAEKLRTGMPKAHIKELMSLTETIKDNPNYILTSESIDIIDYAAPFINDNPFAFADVLGILLGPVLQERSEPTDINGSPLMISSSTDQILINAAKTLNGLTQEQMDNLQNIGDTYQTSEEFDSSEENVNDVSQVIETSYYPSSANLLLPFLGADTLIAMSSIAYNHPYSFNEETVNEYNRNVIRDPIVENYNRAGIAPRYNPNWVNNRADAANIRAQDRGDAADTRAQDRGAAADDRAQNRVDNRGFDGGGRGR